MESLFLASVAALLVCRGDFHLLFNALPSQENIETFTIPLILYNARFKCKYQHLTHIWGHKIMPIGFRGLFPEGPQVARGKLQPDSGRLEGGRQEVRPLTSA